MNTVTLICLIAAITLSIIIPFSYFHFSGKNRHNFKVTVFSNAIAFFGVMLVAIVLLFCTGSNAQAAEAATDVAQNADGLSIGLGYIGAALAVGFSCVGAGIAVASAASAALGALSEDASVMGKSLIFVGLAEGVALYGLVISFMIISKL